MLIVSFCEGFKIDKYLRYYIIFLFFFGISSFITGYEVDFLNKLFGTYLPIIAAYTATCILIQKYNGTTILVWLFVCIGILDAIVTIGQFLHLAYVNEIYSLFGFTNDEEFVDKMLRRDDLSGFTIHGLFAGVSNGYFLSATTLLVLYNKKCNSIINLGLWMIMISASFLAQERTGFYLAFIFSIFIMSRIVSTKGSNKMRWAISLSIIMIAIILLSSYGELLLSSDFRYAKGFDMQNRDIARSSTLDYLLQNPLGGIGDYMSKGNIPPHNIIYNAILYGGIIGGVIIIILLILQMLKIFPYLYKTNKLENSEWMFIFGLMYFDYTLNSLFHNSSIVTGAFLFFVWWGAFIALADSNKPILLLSNNFVKRKTNSKKT